MEKIKVAIVGYGNIGQYALQAVQAAEDMELVGVIRHSAQAQQPKELEGICVVDSVEKLPAKPISKKTDFIGGCVQLFKIQ